MTPESAIKLDAERIIDTNTLLASSVTELLSEPSEEVVQRVRNALQENRQLISELRQLAACDVRVNLENVVVKIIRPNFTDRMYVQRPWVAISDEHELAVTDQDLDEQVQRILGVGHSTGYAFATYDQEDCQWKLLRKAPTQTW